MTEPHFERRASCRAPFSGITLVHTPSREIHCIAGNLSASGMLLYPQRPQSRQTTRGLEAPGAEQVRVTFALPTAPRWIELPGAVVREERDDHRPAWGVRFDGVSEEVGHQLERYVASVARHRRARVVTPPPLAPAPAPTPDRALLPPLPDDAEDESTAPGSPFEETTSRLPADEAALLASTLTPGEEPPTRRTTAAEIAPLKERCRNP